MQPLSRKVSNHEIAQLQLRFYPVPPILNLPSFLPSFSPLLLLCCLLLAIRLFHYPAGDGGREGRKERKRERNRIKIADEIKKREHASLTRSAINWKESGSGSFALEEFFFPFCFDFQWTGRISLKIDVDFYWNPNCGTERNLERILKLSLDPRIENYLQGGELSNSKFRWN